MTACQARASGNLPSSPHRPPALPSAGMKASRGQGTCLTIKGKWPIRPQTQVWPAPESRLFSREVLHTDAHHGHRHLKVPTQRLQGHGLMRSPARGRAPCVDGTHRLGGHRCGLLSRLLFHDLCNCGK